ncbi:MAG: DPP IV N-terminal domain-containing protein [Desulfobacteraceae bacterium]
MRFISLTICTALIWLLATYGPLSWAGDRIPTDAAGEAKQVSETQADPESTIKASPDQSPSVDAGAPATGSSEDSYDGRPADTGSNVLDRKIDPDGEESSPTESVENDSAPPLESEATWTLEPEFIHPLTPVQAGRNDSNPVWSPSGQMLAFERSMGDQRKIVIALRDGTIIKTIYFQTPEEEGALDIFLPGITDTASYNAGLSWSSRGRSLVFMSNAGSGNYDLYLLPDLDQAQPQRLTRHHGKDCNPQWSPTGDRLVFVSGSTGKADIFTMDLPSLKSRRITHGKKLYLYPQWSPDGRKIAMIYGSNENHDVWVIEDLSAPEKSTKTLTTWSYDDLRPVWSPDGSKIAFYSNFNLQGDQKLWCIIVVASDGSDSTSGDALSAHVVAYQVIPDIEQGPAWMPDSRHIVYVKNDEQMFNPIYLVDIEERIPVAVQTRTKMNHDISCASDGTLAFRAQVEQWDHIYIAKIDPEMAAIEELK